MDKEKLLYDLIFSDQSEFNIDISYYISNVYEHSEFIDDIKAILKRSKVKIISSNTFIDSKTAIWKLKVSR